jgi:hypothetical protein
VYFIELKTAIAQLKYFSKISQKHREIAIAITQTTLQLGFYQSMLGLATVNRRFVEGFEFFGSLSI